MRYIGNDRCEGFFLVMELRGGGGGGGFTGREGGGERKKRKGIREIRG